MHEEFVGPGERLADFVSSRLRIVDGAEVPREVVHLAMAELEVAARARNLDAVLQVIARLVPEYRPSESLDAARAAAWMVHHG